MLKQTIKQAALSITDQVIQAKTDIQLGGEKSKTYRKVITEFSKLATHLRNF